MTSLLHLLKDRFLYYYANKPLLLYGIIALATFLIYITLDTINTYFIQFYPIYHSYYAQGTADSVYFSIAVNRLLSLDFSIFNTQSFDGGLLAPFIYAIPVGLSRWFHLDLGYCFRLFYLSSLLITGYGIFLVGSKLYSNHNALKLSLSYIFNPFIFILTVWSGSEEIVESIFFVSILYLLLSDKEYSAIALTFITCFYKYYTVLLLPLIILSISNRRKRISITILLAVISSIVGLFSLLFLPQYVSKVTGLFVTTFHIAGKGLFYLLVEYGGYTEFSHITVMLYYSFIGLVILLFVWFSRDSHESFKYGFIFIIFFLLYPEFYPSYLIIPFISIVMLYPRFNKLLQYINYIILPLAIGLSEFAFNQIDSVYVTLNMQPTLLLRTIGVISLFGLYAIILWWVYLYFRHIFKSNDLDSHN